MDAPAIQYARGDDGVKQLLAGKDFEFVDQGEVALKGFDEPVRAWSVEWH